MADNAPVHRPDQQEPAQTEPSTVGPDETLQVDPDNDNDSDPDSAIDEGRPESTVSLTSTVLRYRTIHGRTYHSERGNAQYW